MGVYFEHDVPAWVPKVCCGRSKLALFRSLHLPTHKFNTFLRGLGELDCGDEDLMVGVVDYDVVAIKTPLEVVLSLRKAALLKHEWRGNVVELSLTTRDPFVHSYEFYGENSFMYICEFYGVTHAYCRRNNVSKRQEQQKRTTPILNPHSVFKRV